MKGRTANKSNRQDKQNNIIKRLQWLSDGERIDLVEFSADVLDEITLSNGAIAALAELADCIKVVNDKNQTKEIWGARMENAYRAARGILDEV